MSVDLRATPIAIRDAAKAVRSVLVEAGAFALQHSAALAVIEIVTRAVTRNTGPCTLVAEFDDARRRLRVEVTGCALDAADRPAAIFPFVTALATDWGLDAGPGETRVWFEMLQLDVADVPV